MSEVRGRDLADHDDARLRPGAEKRCPGQDGGHELRLQQHAQVGLRDAQAGGCVPTERIDCRGLAGRGGTTDHLGASRRLRPKEPTDAPGVVLKPAHRFTPVDSRLHQVSAGTVPSSCSVMG